MSLALFPNSSPCGMGGQCATVLWELGSKTCNHLLCNELLFLTLMLRMLVSWGSARAEAVSLPQGHSGDSREGKFQNMACSLYFATCVDEEAQGKQCPEIQDGPRGNLSQSKWSWA